MEDEIQEESEHREQLRRQMTMLRRIIRKALHDAHLYGSNSALNDLQTQFENHLVHMPGRKECPEVLRDYLQSLDDIRQMIEQTCTDLKSEQHKEISMNCSDDARRRGHTSGDVRSFPSDRSLLNKPVGSFESHIDSQRISSTGAPAEDELIAIDIQKLEDELNKKYNTGIKLDVVLEACSEFASFAHRAHGYIRHWDDLDCAVAQLRPMIGLPLPLWELAQQKLC